TRSAPDASRRPRAAWMASSPSPTISTRSTATPRDSRERPSGPALRSWMRPRRISSPVMRRAAETRPPARSGAALHPGGREPPGAALTGAELRRLAADRHVELGRVGGLQPDALRDLARPRLAGRERGLVDHAAVRVAGAHLHP